MILYQTWQETEKARDEGRRVKARLEAEMVRYVQTADQTSKLAAAAPELLAALKACTEAWAKYLPEGCGEKPSLPWPAAMAKARALIARLEGK